MVSLSETVEMEVHQLLKGDVDTGLVCLSGADLDELVEANRALELENRALREFVRLVDDVVFLMAHREDGDRFHDARQRLATDHGLPLPGAGEDGR